MSEKLDFYFEIGSCECSKCKKLIGTEFIFVNLFSEQFIFCSKDCSEKHNEENNKYLDVLV